MHDTGGRFRFRTICPPSGEWSRLPSLNNPVRIDSAAQERIESYIGPRCMPRRCEALRCAQNDNLGIVSDPPGVLEPVSDNFGEVVNVGAGRRPPCAVR
jgi:hypothetical protein